MGMPLTRFRLDMMPLRAVLTARAAEFAVILLGEPNRAMSSKRELRFGRHGSLSVIVGGPKAGMWHDHQVGIGGDMLSLVLRERGGGFRDAVRFAEEFVGQAPHRTAPPPLPAASPGTGPDAERNMRVALEIWQQATPIAGTIAALYLSGRGLEVPPGIDGPTLRFHASCPYRGARQSCMVTLLRDLVTDAPRAIQRTALSGDGRKIGRMTLGPKAGAAIKLSADVDVANRLTIGEGLETTLAGMLLGYAPAWALGDAGELAAFPVLIGVESITILVDHDLSGTGQQAALRCSARWTSAGREVFRLVPRQPGADVNDLLKCGGTTS
jgi:putative DNA primase/helicase